MTEVRPFGEAALQVTLGDATDPTTLARVHALARHVAADRTAGVAWGAPVPGMTTLLVPFDARAWSGEVARARLACLLEEPLGHAPPVSVTTHRVPVRYGGDDGPDLEAVARRLGLTPERVVEVHASTTYQVALLGFMPGFAYLGDLPGELRLPRRDTPRTSVPAGSVAIAGRHTAVYPATSPGGWHLLGRTEIVPWDIDRDPPALLRPGDRVRFEPVA